MKKAMSLPIVLLSSVLIFGCVANASPCPVCEMAGTHTELQTYGMPLWQQSYNHVKKYTIGGVLYQENCTYVIAEEHIDWVCPNGHGTITSKTHHTETHTCSYCTNLDYYY